MPLKYITVPNIILTAIIVPVFVFVFFLTGLEIRDSVRLGHQIDAANAALETVRLERLQPSSWTCFRKGEAPAFTRPPCATI